MSKCKLCEKTEDLNECDSCKDILCDIHINDMDDMDCCYNFMYSCNGCLDKYHVPCERYLILYKCSFCSYLCRSKDLTMPYNFESCST